MAFREVFLLHSPAGGSRILRQFGRYIYDTLVEYGGPEALEPGVRARTLAIAGDLRFSAQALAALGEERDRAGQTPEDAALAMKAESWAREVLELVRAVESAAAGGGGSE